MLTAVAHETTEMAASQIREGMEEIRRWASAAHRRVQRDVEQRTGEQAKHQD